MILIVNMQNHVSINFIPGSKAGVVHSVFVSSCSVLPCLFSQDHDYAVNINFTSSKCLTVCIGLTCKNSKANAEVKVGETFELVQPGMGTVTWKIETLDSPSSCSWVTEHNGDTLTAVHRLSEKDGKVLNYIELEIQSSGVKSLFHLLLKPLYKLALIKENKGLKSSLEN